MLKSMQALTVAGVLLFAAGGCQSQAPVPVGLKIGSLEQIDGPVEGTYVLCAEEELADGNLVLKDGHFVRRRSRHKDDVNGSHEWISAGTYSLDGMFLHLLSDSGSEETLVAASVLGRDTLWDKYAVDDWARDGTASKFGILIKIADSEEGMARRRPSLRSLMSTGGG